MLYCSAVWDAVKRCTVVWYSVILYCDVVDSAILHCNVVHSPVLYCSVVTVVYCVAVGIECYTVLRCCTQCSDVQYSDLIYNTTVYTA